MISEIHDKLSTFNRLISFHFFAIPFSNKSLITVWYVFDLLFSAHIYNIEGKSSTRSGAFFFYLYLPLSGQNALILTMELFLSPIYGKFSVECDWNSKISHIRTKVGLFEKSWIFFGKNVFFKINKGAKFTVECVSNYIVSWKCLFDLSVKFSARKTRIIFEFRKLLNKWRVFFKKKTF